MYLIIWEDFASKQCAEISPPDEEAWQDGICEMYRFQDGKVFQRNVVSKDWEEVNCEW